MNTLNKLLLFFSFLGFCFCNETKQLDVATGGILQSIYNVAYKMGGIIPLVLLFGLGALFMPKFSALKANPSYFHSQNTIKLMKNMHQVLERVLRALDKEENYQVSFLP